MLQTKLAGLSIHSTRPPSHIWAGGRIRIDLNRGLKSNGLSERIYVCNMVYGSPDAYVRRMVLYVADTVYNLENVPS